MSGSSVRPIPVPDGASRTRVRPIAAGSMVAGPVNVLHVLGSTSRAGIQVRTLELLRHVDHRQYRFHFCLLCGRPGELDDEIRALGGRLHPMRVGLPRFPQRFCELLRRERVNVVHSHVHYFSGYLLRLAARCGTPVRVTHFRSSHSDPPPDPARRLLRALLRPWVDRYATEATMRAWLDRYATHILGVSRWALQAAWGPHWQSDPRCQVVYDGLEPGDFDGAPDGAAVRREFGLPAEGPLLIHVGRMTEAKNHVRLISIFAAVLRNLPEARLLLVGRTSVDPDADVIEKRVRARIAELGIGPRIVFAGQRSDVPRLIKAADLLMFPSLYEGLGDVVLEACAAGTPVLASDLPSIREIAAQLPGVRCLSLDEPDSQWAALAEQMTRHRPSDPARRSALESFATSPFTVGRCAETLYEIWHGAAARSSGGDVANG